MNTKPNTTPRPVLKTAALGFAALTASIAAASGTLTVDLQASAIDAALGTIAGGGKTITLNNGIGGNITLQVWAQVQNAAPTTPDYGLQLLLGSIKSTTISGLISGALSPATILPPWDVGSQIGTRAELSAIPDSIGDLGSNAVTGNGSFVKFRKDSASGGTQVGTTFYATNTNSAGATFAPITNGFEFLMGSVTLTVTNTANPVASLNWAIPGFVSQLQRITIAQWTEADGLQKNGSNAFAEMLVGTPVTLGVPEPAASALLALGALALLGHRRRPA